METLTSLWTDDHGNLTANDHDMSRLGELDFFLSPPPLHHHPPLHHPPLPPPVMWAEHLSPHMHRNKQLQDALLQRDEELLRLQEENLKLREFLESSTVRNLQLRAKRLRRSQSDVGALCSKRLCRNLTPQLSSTATPTEPPLDLWVLRTLGLKDADTIDTSQQDHGFLRTERDWDAGSAKTSDPEPQGGVEFAPTPRGAPTTDSDSLRGAAFSMSLNPSSSVRTHSFPQGQAFVRREGGGRWNFTWVPKQEP
ncbi:geminin coiled-coil domain-containing protein 1 [Gouania willdenowi]|uniref:geminin coiled-coil domain-containing protein 1 n=1 Tax=Gouania willdenowi TaxID=441366 RepID=UPI001055F05B|nr:geminin coiled-coil domain-containing protein 1 [Gouania willdenowi]